MELLTDEKVAELQSLGEMAQFRSDVYADLEQVIERDSLKQECAKWSESRQQLADCVADILDSMGHLPRVPDPEAETLGEWFSRAKAGLSQRGESSLLEDCAEADEVLLQQLDTVLAQQPSEDLEQQRQQLKQDLARIQAIAAQS